MIPLTAKDLKGFQARALGNLLGKFDDHIRARDETFYQELSGMQGSGKTLLLSQFLREGIPLSGAEQMRPVVLYLTTHRLALDQIFSRLSPDGKYALAGVAPALGHPDKHLLLQATGQDFSAVRGNLRQTVVLFSTLPFLTSDDGQGLRESLGLSARGERIVGGIARPLLIICDDIDGGLLGLKPEQMRIFRAMESQALIISTTTARRDGDSATLGKLRDKVGDEAATLESLAERMGNEDVADPANGLLKGSVTVDGYQSGMEEAVSALLAKMEEMGASPKALYLADMNKPFAGMTAKEDSALPFTERQAASLMIWKHLRECGVPAEEILVLGNLRGDCPEELKLLRGKEGDYEELLRDDYKHIIFDQIAGAWDEPLLALVYIDKEFRGLTDGKKGPPSPPLEIQKALGRILRLGQTGDKVHEAGVYFRVDTSPKKQFAVDKKLKEGKTRDEVVAEMIKGIELFLEEQLGTGKPRVKGRGGGDAPRPQFVEPKAKIEIPLLARKTGESRDQLQELIDAFPSHLEKDYSPQRVGEHTAVTRRLSTGSLGQEVGELEWKRCANNMPVRVRERVKGLIRRSSAPDVLEILDLSDERLDALLQIGSEADEHLQDLVEQMIGRYASLSRVETIACDPWRGAAVRLKDEQAETFRAALHEAYSDFANSYEKGFAHALDELLAENPQILPDVTWFRNDDAHGKNGYHIPLLEAGAARDFYPDFVVRAKGAVIFIDVTGRGEHIEEKLRNKVPLLRSEDRSIATMKVCIVTTDGQWEYHQDEEGGDEERVKQISKEGFTVFRRGEGDVIEAQFCPSLSSAAWVCLM